MNHDSQRANNVAAGPEPRALYLDLLEKCLTNQIYEDPRVDWQQPGALLPYDANLRESGRDFPALAHARIGRRRLAHVRAAVEATLRDGVPGDFLVLGAGRGGIGIYLRAILVAHGVGDRRVFLADTFEEPPSQSAVYFSGPGPRGLTAQERYFAASLPAVAQNFAKYGLLDDRVLFIRGPFAVTLASAPLSRLAVLLIDVPHYQATLDGLEALYPRVSAGGYVVAVEYGAAPECRRAVDEFRQRRAVQAPLIDIDGVGAFWQNPAPAVTGPMTQVAPLLAPVPPGVPRPFWSVIITVFNRLDYLGQCLDAVLAQDPGPEHMEIIVQDDHGSVDVPAVLAAHGRGRVRYNRTPANLGLYGNVNAGLACTTGRWVHVIHDDDVVLPGFYRTMQNALASADDSVGVACCHYTNIDQTQGTEWSPAPFREGSGILADWLKRVAVCNPLNVPAVVVRRDVHERIGAYCPALSYTGDWEFYIRAALHYRWWYQAENLARWRIHQANLTHALAASGRTAVDICKTIEMEAAYLPPELGRVLIPQARQYQAGAFLVQAELAVVAGQGPLSVNLAAHAVALWPEVVASPPFVQLLGLPGAADLRTWWAARRAGG